MFKDEKSTAKWSHKQVKNRCELTEGWQRKWERTKTASLICSTHVCSKLGVYTAAYSEAWQASWMQGPVTLSYSVTLKVKSHTWGLLGFKGQIINCWMGSSVPVWGRSILQAAATWTPSSPPLKLLTAGSKTRGSSWKNNTHCPKSLFYTPSY